MAMSPDSVFPDGISQRDTVQALGLMGAAMWLAAMNGTETGQTVFAIVAFCCVLMTLVTGGLFLAEGRIYPERRTALGGFCLPAVGILGFALALLVAAGHFAGTILVLLLALGFAARRRAVEEGAYNLIPGSAFDLGVVGGLGATLGAIGVVLCN